MKEGRASLKILIEKPGENRILERPRYNGRVILQYI